MTSTPLLTGPLHTHDSLVQAFSACGLRSGQVVLVHSSLKKVGGWLCGGPQAAVNALLSVLGDEGTLVMPTQTTDNTEPSHWQYPPVPEEWWPIIREQTPAYDPQTTPTRMMGILVETFRSYSGVLRSAHPMWSFAAKGKHASFITQSHTLEAGLGPDSPLGHLYQLDASIFLFGVGYANNTSLHLAEYKADIPREYEQQGSAMMVDGQRRWVPHTILKLNDDDFEALGADYEAEHPEAVRKGRVGEAETRLMKIRPLVDYAVAWMTKKRGPIGISS